jgi:DNA-binding NarL/FixJ family response regulator
MRTLLVTPPGATAEALCTVLQSIPEVEIVESVTGRLSAVQAIRSLGPALIVVNGQLPTEEILALIEDTVRDGQAPPILIASASPAQEQCFLDAGAFAAVTPWDSVDRLSEAVESALSQQTAADADG